MEYTVSHSSQPTDSTLVLVSVSPEHKLNCPDFFPHPFSLNILPNLWSVILLLTAVRSTFLDWAYEWDHVVFVFLFWLIFLNIIISTCHKWQKSHFSFIFFKTGFHHVVFAILELLLTFLLLASRYWGSRHALQRRFIPFLALYMYCIFFIHSAIDALMDSRFILFLGYCKARSWLKHSDLPSFG